MIFTVFYTFNPQISDSKKIPNHKFQKFSKCHHDYGHLIFNERFSEGFSLMDIRSSLFEHAFCFVIFTRSNAPTLINVLEYNNRISNMSFLEHIFAFKIQ